MWLDWESKPHFRDMLCGSGAQIIINKLLFFFRVDLWGYLLTQIAGGKSPFSPAMLLLSRVMTGPLTYRG